MENGLKKIIDGVKNGDRYPVLDLVRDSPGMAAQISKMIPGVTQSLYDQQGNLQPVAPDVGVFKQASERVGQNISDSQITMQVLPDMELSAQILVSSIISPKDMMSTELTYESAEGLLPPNVNAAMMARIREYLEQDYKITPQLPIILRDMLFNTGSYAAAVIPENSIDEAINGSGRVTLESLGSDINPDGSIRSIGILGPVDKHFPTQKREVAGLSLESFGDFVPQPDIDPRMTLAGTFEGGVETFISVTDNHNLLKIPKLQQKLREQRVVQALRPGNRAMESFNPIKLNDREMTGMIYKDRKFGYKPISTLKTQEQLNRNTVGNPLVLHLPSEAVIPVYVPGSVEQQVGFFVLIDADGNPIVKPKSIDYYYEMGSRLGTSGSFPSAMLNKVSSQMDGFNPQDRNHLDYSARAFGPMVEQDLLARLRNGMYGNGVAIAKKEEVYRIMLARALAKQHTQLLFLPIELMTYFAFRYDDNGFGKSLLDDMKIINALRTQLLFANVMASIKNSIGRTEVKIKVDEHDPNPQKTMEMAKDLILRSRQGSLPIGLSNPADVSDFLAKANVEFTYEGHPGLPDVAIDFGEKSSNYVKPDTELEDSLRRRAIMSTGLSPETVDASFNTEFATSIVTNNILLSKRVMQMQEQFTPLLSDHLRKALMNSEGVVKDLTEILMNSFDELKVDKDDKANPRGEVGAQLQPNDTNATAVKFMYVNRILREFIMNFQVTLPKPNSVTLENQLVALETYSKALDIYLDNMLNTDMFTQDTIGQVSGQVDTVKAIVRSYFIRNWMAENAFLPELSALTTLDEDGKPKLDLFALQGDHLAAMNKSLTQFMVGLQPIKQASDKVMDALVGQTEPAPEPEADAGGGGDGGDNLDMGDDLELDMGDAGGAPPAEGETPPAEDAPPADAEPKADDNAPVDPTA
jgi:hypothetical protein